MGSKKELVQFPKFVYYMPDFNFNYFQVRNFFLSIKSIKLKKKYIQFLKEKVEKLHKEYVIGPATYKDMGKEYLNSIFRDEKMIFPYREKVENFEIYRQLTSMGNLAQSWYEIQIKYMLTDEEMKELSFIQQLDLRSAEQKRNNINPVEKVLEFPFWEDHNDPGLRQAIGVIFDKHASLTTDNIVDFKVETGSRDEKTLTLQAFGYLLKKLFSYIPTSKNMWEICTDNFIMNGDETIDYYKLTKTSEKLSLKRRTYINNLFLLDEENQKMT